MIVTVAEMKAELGIADANDDTLIERLVKGLQARFETACDRVFDRAADVIEEFREGGYLLLVRRFPIEVVSEVTIADEPLAEFDDYLVFERRGQIRRVSQPWPDSLTVEVTYSGGYAGAGTTPGAGQLAMPEDLRRAMFIQGGYEWRNRQNLGRAQVSAQGQSVALAPAKLLPEVEDILRPLKRI